MADNRVATFATLPITSQRTLERCKKLKPQKGDVLICSYPKSGTTWVQSIVAHIFFAYNARQENGLPKKFRHVTDVAPFFDIDKHWSSGACRGGNDDDDETTPAADVVAKFEKTGRRCWNTHFLCTKLFHPSVYHTHCSCSALPTVIVLTWWMSLRVLHFHARKGEMLPKNDDNKEPLMKYIYVQRDGRDALVSFYHHLSAAVPEDGGYAGNWSDFFDDYTKGALPYSRWTDHLVSWSVSQDDKAVLFLRYEDMLSPEGLRHAIREIASHVGCELVHEEDIESIARETTFAAMKSKLSQYHPESVAWREEKNFSFIRKGTTGSHRELFSDAQQEKWRELMIDANANASNATLLEHYNYTISTTSPSP